MDLKKKHFVIFYISLSRNKCKLDNYNIIYLSKKKLKQLKAKT